ncbi:MAG: efflux RND transporter periplasmic adaptor subunit [Candidatus Aminicenantes bacterium]|nr:MAG: efflux RND transporter periplasmic adaptor subunit [Candidatus Aminicenantes bacterium]
MAKNDKNVTFFRLNGGLRMIRRSVSLILIFIIIPFLAFLISCSGDVENQEVEKAEKVRVRATSYKKADYEFTLDFSGEVKAWKTVNLSFNVRGKIDRFYFDEGHKVNKGDLLARLEKDDYQAMRDQSYAQWEKAKRDYERSSRLLEEGSIPERLVQDAQTVLKAAAAALEASELNLKHCLLYAPFSGHVAYRNGEEKEMVAGGQTVFTLMDLSRVLVEIGVPEKNIDRIKKAQKASVNFEAIPGKTFEGTVTQVAVSSLPNIRLFKVEITAENPKFIIKPGMTAILTIVIDKMEGVYIFSLDAAVLRNGRRAIFLASNGRAKKITLEDYLISGDKIIVRDSLPEEGQIITAGQGILFDGIQISVID